MHTIEIPGCGANTSGRNGASGGFSTKCNRHAAKAPLARVKHWCCCLCWGREVSWIHLDLLRAGTGVSLELGSTMCPYDTSDTPAQAPVSGGEGAKLGTQNQVRATRTAVGTLGSGAEPGGVTEQQAPLRCLRGPAALPGELTPSQTHRVKQAANRSLQLI